MDGALDFGLDTALHIWNNLTDIAAGVPPYAGSSVWAFRAHAGAWFGMGVATAPKNMSNYAGGSLKFHMRTSSPAALKIGVKPLGAPDLWLPFIDGGEQYGLVRDGQWHEVTIPLSAFAGLNLSSIEQFFMLSCIDALSCGYHEDIEFFIDDVYWLAPESQGDGAIFEDGFEEENEEI